MLTNRERGGGVREVGVLDNREVARLGQPTHVLHWTHTLIYNKHSYLYIALKKHWAHPQYSKELKIKGLLEIGGGQTIFRGGNYPSWRYVIMYP